MVVLPGLAGLAEFTYATWHFKTRSCTQIPSKHDASSKVFLTDNICNTYCSTVCACWWLSAQRSFHSPQKCYRKGRTFPPMLIFPIIFCAVLVSPTYRVPYSTDIQQCACYACTSHTTCISDRCLLLLLCYISCAPVPQVQGMPCMPFRYMYSTSTSFFLPATINAGGTCRTVKLVRSMHTFFSFDLLLVCHVPLQFTEMHDCLSAST